MARLRPLNVVISTMLETALVSVSGVTYVPRREGDPQTPESSESAWCRLSWNIKYGEAYVKGDGNTAAGALTVVVRINVPAGMVDDDTMAAEDVADTVAAAMMDVTLRDSGGAGGAATHQITIDGAEFEVLAVEVEGEGGATRRFEQGVLVLTGTVQRFG